MVPLAALFAGACQIGGTAPVPFAGPEPQTILVMPPPTDSPWPPELWPGLARAAAGRGYHVPALAVTSQMLRDAGLVPPAGGGWDLPVIGRELQADAVLELEVRNFASENDGERFERARWDLTWRLLATRDGAVLWHFDHHGAWVRPRDTSDPLRPVQAEPEVVPLFAEHVPTFRGRAELAEWLHRLAMARLPEHHLGTAGSRP